MLCAHQSGDVRGVSALLMSGEKRGQTRRRLIVTGADTSCSDLTVLGRVQGEADLPEVSETGPSARPPPRPPGPSATSAPPPARHVFPASLYFQIGGS